MKQYRLVKDLPDCKKGAIFEKGDYPQQEDYIHDTINGGLISYNEKYVENNPDWFSEVVSKEWEIVSFYDGCINGHKDSRCLIKNTWPDGKVQELGFTIHSVRRLSDNEVFSVGDKTKELFEPITHFKLSENKILAYNRYGNWYFLSQLSKWLTPTTFQWTDELVMTYARDWDRRHTKKTSREILNDFKRQQLNTTKEEKPEIGSPKWKYEAMRNVYRDGESTPLQSTQPTNPVLDRNEGFEKLMKEEQEKKERIEVFVFIDGMAGSQMTVRPKRSDWKIPKEKEEAIKQAIEQVLNDGSYPNK